LGGQAIKTRSGCAPSRSEIRKAASLHRLWRKREAISLFFSHVHFEKHSFSKILHGNIINVFTL
jgi:hypothetical protein